MPSNGNHKAQLWLRIGLLLAILALVGLWVHGMAGSAPVVRTATVARQGLTATSSTNGIVEPVQEFEAHAPMSTVVTGIFMKEGDQVAAGKLLLTLDDAAAQASLAQAQASVSSAQAGIAQLKGGGSRSDQLTLGGQIAQATADRDAAQRELSTIQSLAAKGDASPAEVQSAQQRLTATQQSLALDMQRKTDNYTSSDLSRAEATLAEAEASYAAAQDIVAKSNVRAPFAGTVFNLQVHTTQFVQAGDKMLELADLHELRVRAYFDEPELGKLAVGQPAVFKWAARPDQQWSGHILQMPSTIVHYGTRNVGEVVLTVDSSNFPLLSATNVTVTVTTTQHADALVIPREALRLDGSGNYVYVIRNGRLNRANVGTGAVNVSQAEITSGLQQGDTVVLDAADGSPLRQGMSVRTANAN